MGKFRNPILLVVAATIGIVLYGILFDKTAAPRVTFISLKGEQVTTGDLRGKVVVVNFWATDCVTCVKEIPHMAKTYMHELLEKKFAEAA